MKDRTIKLYEKEIKRLEKENRELMKKNTDMNNKLDFLEKLQTEYAMLIKEAKNIKVRYKEQVDSLDAIKADFTNYYEKITKE